MIIKIEYSLMSLNTFAIFLSIYIFGNPKKLILTERMTCHTITILTLKKGKG